MSEMKSFYSVFDRYKNRDDKEIEAWLCRVTQETRNGEMWQQEVEPLAYVYTHEFIHYKFWGIIDIQKIISEASERAEYWQPFDAYWVCGKAKLRRRGRIMMFIFGVFIFALVGIPVWKLLFTN